MKASVATKGTLVPPRSTRRDLIPRRDLARHVCGIPLYARDDIIAVIFPTDFTDNHGFFRLTQIARILFLSTEFKLMTQIHAS